MTEPPPLLRYLVIDLREGLRLWWRSTLRWGGLLALALLPLFALAVWDLSADADAVQIAATIAVALAMDLFYGACGGAIAASVGLLWRLFGVALVVAILLAPLLFFAVLLFLGPWVAAIGGGLLHAWGEAIAARPDLVGGDALGGLGHVGHGGGPAVLLILLVVLLPLALLWLGKASLLLLTPPPLWHLLALVGASALVLGLSLLLAVAIPAPLLIIALVRRLRRRRLAYRPPAGDDLPRASDTASAPP